MRFTSCEVRHYPHGIAVFGALPLGEMAGHTTTWKKEYGMRFMRADLAHALRASLVVVKSDAEAKVWLSGLGATKDNPDWLKSGDCGLSSETIYAVLANHPDIFARGSFSMCAPMDAEDFGKCHRLLARYPEWKSQLHKVAIACREFIPLVPAWDELTALYVGGQFREVSLRLRELSRPVALHPGA